MTKTKRMNIGSICKNKDASKANYLKINIKDGSLTLKNGQYLSVESKSYQLKSLDAAVAEGRLSEENAVKARERIEKIPEFVLAEVILVQEA